MFTSFFFFIWYFFQSWMAMYFIIPVLLVLIYLFKKVSGSQYQIQKRPAVIDQDFSFAAIITAHEDIRLIPPLVDSLMKQTYGKFHVYVVADACKEISTLNFDDARVSVLLPEKNLNSKIKSIDFALTKFKEQHDALVIFDSDNLVHPNFMEVLNLYFKQGFLAVQTNLQPKNTDSLYSRLDSIGDIYYNFTQREIRMELGLSSAIWGLGIAIKTDLYKEIIYENFLGGFDKRIQADIVRRIPQLAFAREALVYDEKVSDGKALEKQRTRWINAYFKYFKLSFSVFMHGIRKLNFNVAFFGFINLRPPQFILIGLALSFSIVNFFINRPLFYSWIILLLLFGLNFFSIIAFKSKDKRILRSFFFLPLFALRQVLALFKIKRANKTFLKTEHNKIVYIEDLLKNEPA